jgi:hypothetical protein
MRKREVSVVMGRTLLAVGGNRKELLRARTTLTAVSAV